MVALAVGAERVNSRGYGEMGQPMRSGFLTEGPIECVRRAIDILESSDYPIPQEKLARKSGYTNLASIQAWLMCLTFYDFRIYEEDDARIGLVGVHRGSNDEVLYDDTWAWLDDNHWSIGKDTLMDIAEQILDGKMCTVISHEMGEHKHVVERVKKRMKKEGMV